MAENVDNHVSQLFNSCNSLAMKRSELCADTQFENDFSLEHMDEDHHTTGSLKPNQSQMCISCNKKFSLKRNLIRHMRNIHSGTSKNHENQDKNQGAVCYVCDKWFKLKKIMFDHMKNIHKVLPKETIGSLQCPLCKYSKYLHQKALREHLLNFHSFVVKEEEHNFPTVDAFFKWKKEEEQQNKSLFVCYGRKTKNGTKKHYYRCDRSGSYIPSGTGERLLKFQGSKKMGVTCSASMEMTESFPIKVTYFRTHCGHEIKVPLSGTGEFIKIEKYSKSTFEKKLDEIRDSDEELLTKKDIRSIERSFELCSKPDEEETESSLLWSEETEFLGIKPVLMFKSRGEKHDDFQENDFILVLMTPSQCEILQKFQPEIICIDSKYGMTNCHDFELTTILAVDDFGMGVPLAYCYSSHVDEHLLKMFYTKVKEKVGVLQCKIFMCNDAPMFYNAWGETMGPAFMKLQCSWNVDHIWRKELMRSIENQEKQILVYELLRVLLVEQDLENFEEQMKDFIKQMFEEDETKCFGEYFQTQYLFCPKEWACCYRLNAGINNIYLENSHKLLESVCLKGKKERRLDQSIKILMKMTKDKLFERLIKIPKDVVSAKVSCSNQRHQAGILIPTEFIHRVNNNTWTINSTSEFSDNHTIVKLDLVCVNCEFECDICCVCAHEFDCTCLDHRVRSSMCKHIHAVVINTNQTDTFINISDGMKAHPDVVYETEGLLQEPNFSNLLLNSACDSDIEEKLNLIQSELKIRCLDESVKCSVHIALDTVLANILDCPLISERI